MPYDDLQELFYLVNKDDKILGSVKRKKAHADKTKIHRSVFVIVLNSKNQILLQKRSLHKDTAPGHWTISVGGHVTFGDTYRQAALKEAKEELDIAPKIKFVTKTHSNLGYEQEMSVIYQTKLDKTPTNFDKTEISELKWVNLKDLPKFVKTNPVSPGCLHVLTTMKYI